MIHEKWIPNRDHLGTALNDAGLIGRGVELGVFRGDYSEILLDTWDGNVLFSIDEWRPVDGPGFRNTAKSHLGRYGYAINRLKKFGHRSTVVRAESSEGAKLFSEKTVDFVYIDAGHRYEQVKRDIKLWSPLIKKGGWLCGHDWFGGEREGVGVTKAVMELGKDVWLTDEDQARSWMVKI